MPKRKIVPIISIIIFKYSSDTLYKYSSVVLYYVESDYYMPLRGNGWYYHNMICYCIENHIIKVVNTKYVIAARWAYTKSTESIYMCPGNLTKDCLEKSFDSG